jgi:serine/threonine-protein kinase RsbW
MDSPAPTAQSLDVRHGFTPDGGSTLELRFDSHPDHVPDVRRALEHFAARAGFSQHVAADVGLSVNEALANVLRHAYRGAHGKPVVITAEYATESSSGQSASGALRVTIRDWGSGVNPAASPTPPRDPLKPGGVGLICMRRLMDQVTFAPQPDGMLLTMIKRNEQGAVP